MDEKIKKASITVEGYEVEQQIPMFDTGTENRPYIELPKHWAGKNVVCILTE